MNTKHHAWKKWLMFLLTAGLLLALLACQADEPNATDATISPDNGALTTPAATDQATDAPMENTPDGTGDEATADTQGDDTDAAAEDEADADEPELSSGTGAYTITADTAETGKSYQSESPDENALRVENGCTASVRDATIQKISGDSSNVAAGKSVGLNAAMLLHDGAQFSLAGSGITSDATGAAGAFARGADTYLIVDDTSIRTSGDDSAGIVAAGGAIIAAKNLAVSTQGASSPAICVDQTGGSISSTGGTFTTGGTDSPVIYTAGSVSAQNATLRANHSAAIVVDGGGSVTLNDCTVSGNMIPMGDGENNRQYTVLMSRSASDANADGQSAFVMTGGALNANSGDLFYVTNADVSLSLSNVALSVNNGVLLRVAGNDGQDGGKCSLTAINQILNGKILVDEVSSLDLALTDGTSFTGSVNPDGASGDVSVELDDDSTWTLTGDAYLTAFSGKTKNIETNGYTVYVNGSAITE